MGISLFGGGFGFLFSAVPVIVILGFIAVFGIIIVTAISGGIRWNKNNHSPVLRMDARVVGKRMDVSRHHHHHGNDMHTHHTTSSMAYYITFEVESGDRMEFRVRDGEYGMLAEGDAGKLTFQGTRYKNFERDRI